MCWDGPPYDADTLRKQVEELRTDLIHAAMIIDGQCSYMPDMCATCEKLAELAREMHRRRRAALKEGA